MSPARCRSVQACRPQPGCGTLKRSQPAISAGAARSGLAMQTFLLVLDLVGTFVFALSGGMAGVNRRLDIFGVLVLAFVAANTGGIARDLLIGAVPPAAIADWRYLAVALAAGLITFYAYDLIARLRSPVLMFDGAGLALFAVAGTQKALGFGLDPVMAAVLGRGIQAAQIRAVRQPLLTGQHLVLAHAPQKVGPGHGGCAPQIEADEGPVSQA